MNGVATITMDGTPLRLKFGLPAVRRIMEKMAERQIMNEGVYSDVGLAHILYAGYLNGCLMQDEVATIPFEQFYEHVENVRDSEAARQEVEAAIAAFTASRFVKQAKEKLDEAEEKKSPSTGTE